MKNEEEKTAMNGPKRRVYEVDFIQLTKDRWLHGSCDHFDCLIAQVLLYHMTNLKVKTHNFQLFP